VFTTQDGLSGNDVRSVCTAPNGALWAATGGGLSHYGQGAWTLEGKAKLRSVASDQQGRAWFGGQGAGQAQLRRDRYDPPRDIVGLGLDWQDPNTLRFATDGTLWVVCERGLTWVKPDRLAHTPDGNWAPDSASSEPAFGRYRVGEELPKLFPLGLVEDREGSMWMGSLAHGLVHLARGRVETFTQWDGLPANYSVPVYLDRAGALWIVGEGRLTRRWEGEFQNLTVKDGLPQDVLLDLIEDDLGNFWLSGKRGIHRLAQQDVEAFFAGRSSRVQSLTLGPRHGLLTPECSSLHYPTMAKTPDGHIWVATRNGLATFDPQRVRLDTQPLPALIERLRVNHRDVPLPNPAGTIPRVPAPPVAARAETANLRPTRAVRSPEPSRQADRGATTLRLPPGSGERLEAHYTAISLVAADRVKFRHRLDGYDADWSPETDLRLAFYTNLRPGAYQFRVQAANAHGVWNEQAAALSFVIQPYFWQTTPFYVALAIGLAAVGAGWHWRRLAGQRRLQELKHRQALMDERTRIAADLHDELGAALTQISILSEVAKGRADDAGQTRSSLQRISDSARDVTARISDLVWATNPHHDTLDNLVAYLREHAASQIENAPFQARLEFAGQVPELRVSATFRRNLLLVLKEALHNVIKHAAARTVTVQLEVVGSNLMLRIGDDGRGFEPSARRPAGNGLGNIEKRIAALGGQSHLRSAPGAGTVLEVHVPLPRAR